MEVWGGNQAADTSITTTGLDAWVYSRPHRGSETGGGDVHYISSCASGRLTRLLLADVSGHGASVVDVARRLRNLMRRHVNVVNPGRFVRQLNQQFEEGTEVGCFATALVATYFKLTGKLTLCNAGHPPPLFFNAASNTWSLLGTPRSRGKVHADLPLGVDKATEYEPFSLRLERGDCVLCYTDAVIESLAEDGRQLGQAGLLELARSLDPTNPREAIEQLLNLIMEERSGNLADDDLTVLLFRPNDQRVRLWDTLMSPIRVLVDSFSRRGIKREPLH